MNIIIIHKYILFYKIHNDKQRQIRFVKTTIFISDK